MPAAFPVNAELLARIRGEYDEMPGLRLTSRQAERLWNLNPTACAQVLAALVQQEFLSQAGDGAFLRRGSGRQSA